MSSHRQAALLERERRHLGHGISEEATASERVFASGAGDYLTDLDGKRYIDLAAGIFTQSVGHCHPHVVQALQRQAATLWTVHDCATPERAALMPPGLDT